MKIALVRGNFSSPWELQSYQLLQKKHCIDLFTGYSPIADVNKLGFVVKKLHSPTELKIPGINKLIMGINNRMFSDAHVLFGLEDKLKKYNIAHVAESYYYYTHQAIKAKRDGAVKAVVSTIWENLAFNNESIMGRKEMKKKAFENIDKFLAVTEFSRKALEREGCPNEKIVILKPGVDLTVFRPLITAGYRGIKRNNKTKLLFIGRLEIEKGIYQFAKKFREMNIHSTELVIVGTGSLKNVLMDMAKDKNIHLLGGVPYGDIPKVFGLCDIYIHPAIEDTTWTEQFGMVLVEAMACGLPVIATKSGSIEEVVDRGMVTDLEKFPYKLLRLIGNKELVRKLGNASQNFARRNYDRVIFSNKLEKIYEGILYKQLT